MKKIISGIISAVLAFSAMGTVVYAEEKTFPSGVKYSDIETEIESYIDNHKDTTTGMAMTIYDRDGVIYKTDFGCVNKEENTAVDEDSVFEWGSVSKLLVWTSVMQLKEQGMIDLEADIKTYLPDGFLKLKYDKPITMLDLMNHQAGFQEVYIGMQTPYEDKKVSLETAMKKYQPAQVFEPGTVTAYSNYGASLAAYIVERISGIDYAEYVKKNIFDVLGMEHTSASIDLHDNEWVKEQRKKDNCYDLKGNKLSLNILYINFYPAGSATGTISDFTLFARALTPDPEHDCPLFKNPDTLTEMCTPTSYYGNSGVRNFNHGMITNQLKVDIIGHGGNTMGQSAMLMFDPESGIGMTVMTNQAHEKVYNYNMYEIIFGKFSDSKYADIERTVPKGFWVNARGIYEGPLKIFSAVGLNGFSDEDLNSWWYQDGDTLYGGISDLSSSTASVLAYMAAAVLLVVSGIYSIVSLIASLIRKIRKKENILSRFIITGSMAAAFVSTIAIIVSISVSGMVRGDMGTPLKYCILALVNFVSMFGIGAGIVTAFVKKEKKPKLAVVMGVIMIITLIVFDLIKFWSV